jgi:phosphoglycolate phosphatase-like HAD superfamily hydrolase
MKKTVVFDFDGVINSYRSGWQGNAIIPDPPVPGIKEAIDEIRAAGYEVVVVSTRCNSPFGRDAIRAYLSASGIRVDAVQAEKPPAIVYIDDRAICFDGKPETLLEKIDAFKPWNK